MPSIQNKAVPQKTWKNEKDKVYFELFVHNKNKVEEQKVFISLFRRKKLNIS